MLKGKVKKIKVPYKVAFKTYIEKLKKDLPLSTFSSSSLPLSLPPPTSEIISITSFISIKGKRNSYKKKSQF